MQHVPSSVLIAIIFLLLTVVWVVPSDQLQTPEARSAFTAFVLYYAPLLVAFIAITAGLFWLTVRKR